jgi:hypothetical protein
VRVTFVFQGNCFWGAGERGNCPHLLPSLAHPHHAVRQQKQGHPRTLLPC